MGLVDRINRVSCRDERLEHSSPVLEGDGEKGGQVETGVGSEKPGQLIGNLVNFLDEGEVRWKFAR